MTKRIHIWARGIGIALAAMAIFAVTIVSFISLTLLVISMEEGGANLSDSTVSLTGAIVLLSQGIGFSSGSFTLGVTPLLLSLLLIALIRQLAQRFGTSLLGYCAGLLTWIVLNLLFVQNTSVNLSGSMISHVLRSSLVFSLGYLLADISNWKEVKALTSLYRKYVSSQIRLIIRIGIITWLVVSALFIGLALCTCVYWLVVNHQGMARLFTLLNMGMGSRILTSIASLMWVPNLCMWALAWVTGSNFQIGDAGYFSMWLGKSTDLPPIPAFGMLPDQVSNDVIRTILLTLPMIIGFVVALVVIVHPRSCDAWKIIICKSDEISKKQTIIRLTYPIGALCITATLMVLSFMSFFGVANGPLGKDRLAHVGVNTLEAIRSVAQPTFLGFTLAWILVVVIISFKIGIHIALTNIHRRAEVSNELDVESLHDTNSVSESIGDNARVISSKDYGSTETSTTVLVHAENLGSSGKKADANAKED
ncbi:DUF6350 family protein [Bifidobacterium aquikefiri]|uniref:cell division protein PerM n=1 Tax=Bifidobacterium aquikefiri TaxID=1653207 RepID=UPI0039E96663